MAMLDYGAIALKNGKLISTEVFTPMVDMVGWEDTEADVYESRSHEVGEPESNYMKPLNLTGNFFAYIGDEDCTLAFYKEQLVIVERYGDGTFSRLHEFFNCSHYTWSKWETYAGVGDNKFPRVRVTKRNGYLVCKWKYRGDKYKVYFGYGVDLPCYKKYRIVNYYRSPMHIIRRIPRWIKDMIYESKYYR
jgi:hypothetical protein